MDLKPKILIVDDKPENLLALERLLDGVGAEFVRAESGNAAIAKTLDEDFALALIDVQMPGMDGFDTVELLRQEEKTRYLPVIFVSAIYNEEAHLIRGVESGAVDFIVKPIVPEILIGKVKIFLELYFKRKELEALADDRKKREQTFKLLSQGIIGGVTDQDIYNCIVKTSAAIFNTEYAMIGRFAEEGKIKTCALLIDGQFGAPMVYDLKDTPCDDVINKGPCTYPKGVRQLFPKDLALIEMGIEGYVGVPLKDSHGIPIGILNAYSKNAMHLPDYAIEVLEILAGRASAVLERQREDENKTILKERLQQAQKMEAIGTLAGGIAHDFNNILSPLLGYSEMAMDSVSMDDPLREKLAQVMAAAGRAKNLVRQILTFSRHSSQEEQPLQISLVVKEALKLLRATIPTTIEIKKNIEPDCGLVLADPTQIHQVVINLCTNAYQAMRQQGGVLTVSLVGVELGNDAASKTNDTDQGADVEQGAGKYMRLEISDTGFGMDRATLSKIFDPYFTTKPMGEGTGLGLSVVHGIVEKCHGKIHVSSEPGKGTVFRVDFPVTTLESLAPTVAEPVSSIPTGNELILLVDDEETIRLMTSEMLKRLGYQVVSFNSPVEAFEKFMEQPETFDLIVTDMTMPVMTGVQLAQNILKQRPDMPIILCTGFSELIDQKQARELGIKGYLLKPASRHDLAVKIRELLD